MADYRYDDIRSYLIDTQYVKTSRWTISISASLQSNNLSNYRLGNTNTWHNSNN